MALNIQSVPQSPIGECHPWRDWLTQLARLVNANTTSSGVSIAAVLAGGGSDVILTSSQANSSIIEISGILTANIKVIVPALPGQWTVHNGTTGNFTVTFIAVTGTGLVLQQGFRGIFYFDGINIVRSNDPAVG